MSRVEKKIPWSGPCTLPGYVIESEIIEVEAQAAGVPGGLDGGRCRK
jgi:hypothetical protein